MIARLAKAPGRGDHDRGIGGRQRRRVAQQGGGVDARIRIERRERRDPLECGQVLGRGGEQLLEDRGGRRPVGARILEDPGEPQAQRGHVVGRRTALDRVEHPCGEDVHRFATLATAREHVRVVDEPADVLGGVVGGLGDHAGGRLQVARLFERARGRPQQRGLLHPALRAGGSLAANLGQLAPAAELGEHIVECAPRIGIRRPARHDRAVDRGRVVEPAVVAIELPGGTQRGARAIVVREGADALERLGRLGPRSGAAVQPREPVVVVDVVGVVRDDRLHRGDLLERLIEVLVDVGELLEECRGDLGAIRGARLVGEQERELLPQALLGGQRAQPPARLGIAGRGAHRDDHRPQHVQRIRRALGSRDLVPASGPFIRHGSSSLSPKFSWGDPSPSPAWEARGARARSEPALVLTGTAKTATRPAHLVFRYWIM